MYFAKGDLDLMFLIPNTLVCSEKNIIQISYLYSEDRNMSFFGTA